MKLIGSVYQDANGNIWLISSQSLPKKRGEYKYWLAANIKHWEIGDREIKAEKKSDLKTKLNNF